MLEASVDRDAPSASGGSTEFPPDHPDPIDPRWFALVIASVSVPLLVAVAVLRTPRWYPIGDLAQAELRTRDVGTTWSLLCRDRAAIPIAVAAATFCAQTTSPTSAWSRVSPSWPAGPWSGGLAVSATTSRTVEA